MSDSRKKSKTRHELATGLPRRSTNQALQPTELRAAKKLFRRGEFSEALNLFRACLKRYPDHPHVLLDAASAFGERFQSKRCGELLARLIQLAPHDASVHFRAGCIYRRLSRFTEARDAFERSLHLLKDNPHASYELAYLYERSHRLDESFEILKQLRQSQPQHSGVHVLLGRVLRRQGEIDRAERELQGVAQSDRAAANTAAEAWGELTLLYDGENRYDEAWDANLASKQRLLADDQREWHAAQVVMRRFAPLAEQLERTDVQRWQQENATDDSERICIFTGFPRCGTTLLERFLRSHSQIACVEEQPILSAEIFPSLATTESHEQPVLDLLRNLSQARATEARSVYRRYLLDRLDQPLQDRWLIDKNPALTLMLPVAARVVPGCRFLVAVRDPRDVVVSCFLRYFPLNPVSVCFLTPERLVERYLLDVQSWLITREKVCNRWTEVRYEDLVETPIAGVERVMKLFDESLEPKQRESINRASQNDAMPLGEVSAANTNQADQTQSHQTDPSDESWVASPSYESVARPISDKSVGRWQNYADRLAPQFSKLHTILAELGYC